MVIVEWKYPGQQYTWKAEFESTKTAFKFVELNKLNESVLTKDIEYVKVVS